MLSILDVTLIIVYFLAIIIVGYMSSRKESKEGYIIGEKKIGTWHNIATLSATKITASLIITYVALVYVWGISALWLFVGAAVGYLLFLIFGIKLKKEGDKHNYYSIADYFYHRYGYFTGKIVSIAMLVIFFFNFTIQIIGGTLILKSFIGLPFPWGVFIVTGIIFFYLFLGGFKAVVKTDVVQFVAIALLFTVLGVFLFSNFSYEATQWDVFSSGPQIIIPFFLIGILFPFSAPDLWQRVLAAKSIKSLKKSFALTIFIYVLFGILLSLIAMIIKLKFPAIEADTSLLYGFSHLLPAGLLGMGLVALFAAIMSSADSFAFVCAGLLMHDVILRDKPQNKVFTLRYGLVLVLLLGAILALAVQSLLSLSYLFAGCLMVYSVMILATWFRASIKPTTLNYTMTIGIVLTCGYALIKGLAPMLIVVGIISGLMGMLTGAIVSWAKKQKV